MIGPRVEGLELSYTSWSPEREEKTFDPVRLVVTIKEGDGVLY